MSIFDRKKPTSHIDRLVRKPLKPLELIEHHHQTINDALLKAKEEAIMKEDDLSDIININKAMDDIDFVLRKLVFTRF